MNVNFICNLFCKYFAKSANYIIIIKSISTLLSKFALAATILLQ